MEMELMTVKCEGNPGGHHLSMADAADAPAAKCVKRRRRDLAEVALGFDDHQKEKQQRQQQQEQEVDQSSTRTTVKRSSRFRGVSRHRWTGRFEAHLWDKGSWNVTQKKKGKQVYLGAYDEEQSAARAYDLAALKYWGPTTFINFPVSDYEKEIEIMQSVTKEEYLASLRRKSSGFSRGVSKYRGVARHHHNGRWEARIGRVFGNKYLYLGTYSTQEEAAHAYDIAAIEYRGINAVTNFDLSTYIRWLRPGGNALVAIPQEPRTNVESQAVPSLSNLIPSGEPETSFFHTSIFTNDDLGSPQKQEVFQRKTPVSPCSKPSSPTALSLLLRSSIFRELVEKNASSTDDGHGEDTRYQTQIGSDNDCGEIFYGGISDIPYEFPSNVDTLPTIELHETASSIYKTGQSIWNGVLSMSSIH